MNKKKRILKEKYVEGMRGRGRPKEEGKRHVGVSTG